MRCSDRFLRVATLALIVACAPGFPANPRGFADAADRVETLYLGSYITECQAVIQKEARVRDLFLLLDEARPALVEAYEPELWFIVEWRDGPTREFYVGPDWVAPVQTGLQDAISGWRLRSQSFQAALVLALDHGCFQPLPPNKRS